MNYTNILFVIALTGSAHFSYCMEKKVIITAEGLAELEKKPSLDFCTPRAHLYTSLDYDPKIAPAIPNNIGYKEKLKKAHEAMAQQRDMYHPMDTALMDVHQEYNEVLANIALNSHDMPELEKLEYLYGDQHYQCRKKIIISLIKSGMNPNHITYQRTTAFEESIKRGDVALVELLLKVDVTPSQKDIQLAQQSLSDAIKKLFELYA